MLAQRTSPPGVTVDDLLKILPATVTHTTTVGNSTVGKDFSREELLDFLTQGPPPANPGEARSAVTIHQNQHGNRHDFTVKHPPIKANENTAMSGNAMSRAAQIQQGTAPPAPQDVNANSASGPNPNPNPRKS